MSLRAVLIVDGPSDLPMAGHLEQLCAVYHREVQITAIDPRHLSGVGRRVEDRLRFILNQETDPDLVFVHRDAEAVPPGDRVAEVMNAAQSVGISEDDVVPVVPVRMTEAWLLLDEAEIRRVAGRPNGSGDLALPRLAAVESVADPKALLRDVLLQAGSPSGRRRRQQFERDFGQHRALLLQRLDIDGPVTQLSSWQRLRRDIRNAMIRNSG